MQAAERIDALLESLDGISDPIERANILVHIGVSFRDELGDRSQAADAMIEAIACDPLHPTVLEQLEPLLRSEGKFPEALSALESQVPRAPDATRAVALVEILVRWLTNDLPQPERARHWVERIRRIDSTHSLVHLMEAAVARERGDLKRELDELDFAALSAKRPDERANIHLLMATRYCDDRTRNAVQAKKHFLLAHKLVPRKMAPLLGLERLAVQEGDQLALADVLAKQSECDIDSDERISILLRLGKLEEEEFKRPELAAKTYERVFHASAEHSGALDGLERCYRAARAWEELAGVLERGAASTDDASVRTERLKRLGDVLESKLGDVRAALATYQRLSGLIPDDATVLGELARLSEKVGDIGAAVGYRERLAESSDDPALRARLRVVAGQLLLARDEPEAARRQFELAAEADPTNASAWHALLWDAREAGDKPRALRYLEDRANRTETPRARATAFVELADAYAKSGDPEAALEAYEQAASADPTNEIAANALVGALVEAGRHEQADRIIGVAIAAAERDRDYERLFSLRRALTTISTALGKPDRALSAALAAYELRGDSVEAQEALVAAAVPLRADPQIHTAHEALSRLAENPDWLSLEGRVGLADVLVMTGDGEVAAALYDAVLAEDPDNARALVGLSQHHTATGNPIAALSLQRQRARGVPDVEERFTALLEVAEAFASRAKNDELAADVYEEARTLKPHDLPTLHKLMALHTKLARWPAVYDVLRSLAEADSDPVRRAKTYFTMATLAKEELADRGAALAHFDKVLDVDPSQLVAFERIVRMLTEDKDWLGLEQMYKKMLLRAFGGDKKLQFMLYKQLALIYRDRICDAELALNALRAAMHLDPDEDEVQAMTRELLARAGHTEGALAITLERVQRDPLDASPYRALFDLLVRENAVDRALCVASAMRFLGITHPQADALRAAHPPRRASLVTEDLGEEGYRLILHPDLDPSLTEIFEVVAPALVDMALSRLSIRERLGHPGPALKGHDDVAQLAARAAKIFGVPVPRLHARRSSGPALTIAATKPASLLVSPAALAGISADLRTFLVGKRILETSPPLWARALCPSITELRALGSSAARIASSRSEAGDQALRERLKKDDVARLEAAVSRALAASGTLDVLRWSQLADLSASRAGLLLAGDLETARAAIAIEPQSPGDLTPREKMKELVSFFLGDACASFRQKLGLAGRHVRGEAAAWSNEG